MLDHILVDFRSLNVMLMRDYEKDEDINQQLDKMGYNIGVRLIEDFFARSQQGRCHDLKETADVLAKVGLSVVYLLVWFTEKTLYSTKILSLGSPYISICHLDPCTC